MTPTRNSRSPFGEFIYESFLTGAVGGSVVALTFLLVDSVFGHPLFTPSLLGEVLFFGASPASVGSVSIGAAALYTPVHFALFFLVGAVASALARTIERDEPRPFWVMLVLFCSTEGGYLLVTHFYLHGVAEALNLPRVAGVNLTGAIFMVWFLHSLHRGESTERAVGGEPLSTSAT